MALLASLLLLMVVRRMVRMMVRMVVKMVRLVVRMVRLMVMQGQDHHRNIIVLIMVDGWVGGDLGSL